MNAVVPYIPDLSDVDESYAAKNFVVEIDEGKYFMNEHKCIYEIIHLSLR